MGLFDWIQQLFYRDDGFLDPPEEDSADPAEEDIPAPSPSEEDSQTPPELYSGMRVEVTTPENHLLFVGRLKIYGAGVLEVRCEPEGQAPQAMYKQAVKIRGFQKNAQAFSLNGTVCRSCEDFWHIENLQFLQSRDHRDFFRQHADLKGTVTSEQGDFSSLQLKGTVTHGQGQELLPCNISDISASGVRLAVKKEFQKGDDFLLELTVVPEEAPFSLVCQVQWFNQRRRDFEYGCRFQNLSEKEQERLLQAILALQRKILQSKRDAM